MAHVAGHLGVDELQAGYRGSDDATLARHYQVIWLLAQGRTCAEVAGLTSFALRWVEQLLERYNAFGPGSLGDRRRGNGAAPTVLTPAMLAAVRERVRRPPDDGGSGRRRRWRCSWRSNSGATSPSSAAGKPCARSAGRSRARGRATRKRRPPRRRRRSKKACRGRRGGSRAPSRRDGGDLRHRRAPDRPGADPAPGLGPARPASDRPRPPPLRVVLRHRLSLARDRRELLVSLHRRQQGALRGHPRPLRPRGGGGAGPDHRPRPRRRRLAHPAAPRPRGHPPRLPAALHPRAAAGRDPLGSCRRAHRQPALRDACRHRRRRRRLVRDPCQRP